MPGDRPNIMSLSCGDCRWGRRGRIDLPPPMRRVLSPLTISIIRTAEYYRELTAPETARAFRVNVAEDVIGRDINISATDRSLESLDFGRASITN